MVSRRAVLGGLAGASAGLAGCIPEFCGDPFPGFGLELTVDSVVEDGDGWRTTVAATVDYLNVERDDVGVTGLAIGAYDPSPSLLEAATVGSLRWGDVPEGDREDDGCAPSGSITRRVELATPEPPHAIGPRLHSDDTRRAFENGDLDPVDALVHANRDGSEWPPATVDAGSYEVAEVRELPWPTPDDVAIDRSPGLSDVGFRIEPHCPDIRRDHQLFVDREGFQLHWDRAVPADGPSRPVLLGASRSGTRVELRIGLRTVPYVPERQCSYRRYVATGSTTGSDGADDVEVVAVTHLGPDGETVERGEFAETD